VNITVDALKKRILAARREIPAHLVLKQGRVVNVFSGEVQERDVAIYDGVIVGLGSGLSPGLLTRTCILKAVCSSLPGLLPLSFHTVLRLSLQIHTKSEMSWVLRV
jgi:dihydroorotase-like cyclic amidohydrolase